MHRCLMTELERGLSPRPPRTDKEEEAKCAFGPSVSTRTFYPSCSSRIGACARGILSYGVKIERRIPQESLLTPIRQKNYDMRDRSVHGARVSTLGELVS